MTSLINKPKFNWRNYDYLGHKFTPIYNSTIDNGWHQCSICNVKIYTDTDSHFANKLMYLSFDLFHDNTVFIGGQNMIKQFNLTCNEIIIKKIIE